MEPLTLSELLDAIERLDRLVMTPASPGPFGGTPMHSPVLGATLDSLLHELSRRASFRLALADSCKGMPETGP